MEEINIHDYPSLAAYVRLRRMAHTTLSVRGASGSAGFPSATWGSIESGRLPRPSFSNLHAIARVLGVRPWPLALIAGSKPLGRLSRIGELVTDHLPTENWWDQRGAAFLRSVRESRSRTLDEVADTWAANWPAIPEFADPSAWTELERSGKAPELPKAPAKTRQPAPGHSIQTFAGGWWWALLSAACGDPEGGYYFVPAMGVVLGEAEIKVARAMDDSSSFERLVAAYESSRTPGRPETFDDRQYFALAEEVAHEMSAEGDTETPGQRLLRVETAWGDLSADQQEHVVALVEDLARGYSHRKSTEVSRT